MTLLHLDRAKPLVESDPVPVVQVRRRQWGAEKPRPPLPMIEKPAGHAATWLGGFAITATALAWVLYLLRTVISGFIDRGFHDSGLL